MNKLFGGDSVQIHALLNPSADELEGLEQSIKVMRAQVEAFTNDTPAEERNAATFPLATALITHVDAQLVTEGLELMEMIAYQQWQQQEEQ